MVGTEFSSNVSGLSGIHFPSPLIEASPLESYLEKGFYPVFLYLKISQSVLQFHFFLSSQQSPSKVSGTQRVLRE